jgi:hypothetical protein
MGVVSLEFVGVFEGLFDRGVINILTDRDPVDLLELTLAAQVIDLLLDLGMHLVDRAGQNALFEVGLLREPEAVDDESNSRSIDYQSEQGNSNEVVEDNVSHSLVDLC